MVFVLTTPIGAGHIDKLFERFGRQNARDLAELTYDRFVRRGRAHAGTYIFTDRTRMSEEFRALAIDLWDQLCAGGDSYALLNDPRIQMGRHELLRTLYESGLNPFNVYRLSELGGAAVRFPVFLRGENDHGGPRTELIHSMDQVWVEAAQLALAGLRAEDILVVEFVDVSDEQGHFRKYGAYRFKDRIVSKNISVATTWNVKSGTRFKTPEVLEESNNFYLQNPHERLLMPFFEAGHIEYGRIDYGMLNGKVVVWEINDNPQHFSRSFLPNDRFGRGEVFFDAFKALDQAVPSRDAIPIRPRMPVPAMN